MNDEYFAWLEQQTWIYQEGVLTFFDDERGPREFVETASGWAEMEAGHDDPADDLTSITDQKVIALLNAKKSKLQPN